MEGNIRCGRSTEIIGYMSRGRYMEEEEEEGVVHGGPSVIVTWDGYGLKH